jgi:hypothetical protein
MTKMASNPIDIALFDVIMAPPFARGNFTPDLFSSKLWCSNASLADLLLNADAKQHLSLSSLAARRIPSYDRQVSFYVRQRIILDVYVVSALCLIGFIGNALTIAVLRRDRLQDGASTATNWLLRSLAAVDTVYLVSCLFIQTMKTAHDFTVWFPDPLRPYFPYAEQFIWPVASIAHTMTVWTVLLVTVDRYIAVCRPFDSRLRTAERVKAMFAIVCLLAVAYNVPQFFERRVIEKTDPCTGAVGIRLISVLVSLSRVGFVTRSPQQGGGPSA